ncbi:MAG: phage tail protein [Ginsengibacter sp.]|jgi:phage tail-like protein
MPDIFYQTVNFHFKVDFNFDAQDKTDIRFQSVTGLDSTLDTEQIKEGGENRFEHVLPVRRKYGPLTLKRGLLKQTDSKLTQWLKQAFDDEVVVPRPAVTISLLDEQHNALMHWTINNVWPRSWKIGELNAEQGAVLIETLELNYNRLLFDNP